MLQPNLLALPGSLSQELIQLIDDLQTGRYERDPSLGDLPIQNYCSKLKVMPLNSFLGNNFPQSNSTTGYAGRIHREGPSSTRR
jgi:hypothetical protein